MPDTPGVSGTAGVGPSIRAPPLLAPSELDVIASRTGAFPNAEMGAELDLAETSAITHLHRVLVRLRLHDMVPAGNIWPPKASFNGSWGRIQSGDATQV